VPDSRLKSAISRILHRERFVERVVRIKNNPQGTLRIYLRYTPNRSSVIRGLERVSKPGRRIYYSCDEIPRVLGGLGTMILTTSRGVLTDQEARRLRVGGEPLCKVW
ncbi:MAG: uS8 family ribosomal protein, partial [bacterium]